MVHRNFRSCLIKLLIIYDQVVLIDIATLFKEFWYKLLDINMVEALVFTQNYG